MYLQPAHPPHVRPATIKIIMLVPHRTRIQTLLMVRLFAHLIRAYTSFSRTSWPAPPYSPSSPSPKVSFSSSSYGVLLSPPVSSRHLRLRYPPQISSNMFAHGKPIHTSHGYFMDLPALQRGTSRRTTWTCSQSTRWGRRWTSLRVAWCSSLTTRTSAIRWGGAT
jgi:hypothetical protein